MNYRFKKNIVTAIVAVFIVITALYQFNYIDLQTFLCLLIAKIITTVNFFIGLFTYDKGLNKDDKSFLLMVLGGQITRLFGVLIFIILGSNMLKLNNNLFILLVFIFYFIYLILEIFYLVKARSNSLTKYYG